MQVNAPPKPYQQQQQQVYTQLYGMAQNGPSSFDPAPSSFAPVTMLSPSPCKQCQHNMFVERTVKKDGANFGKKFWACMGCAKFQYFKPELAAPISIADFDRIRNEIRTQAHAPPPPTTTMTTSLPPINRDLLEVAVDISDRLGKLLDYFTKAEKPATTTTDQ